MERDNTENLHSLGSQKTEYVYSGVDASVLEVFENQFPAREYKVQYVFPEFTSLCPKTGQPDFATITLDYIPDSHCIETKSLKLYYLSYRQHGAFMETITNQILEDCVTACLPRWMRVTARFKPRGGTFINVEAEYTKKK